jgi:hypothetical protein
VPNGAIIAGCSVQLQALQAQLSLLGYQALQLLLLWFKLFLWFNSFVFGMHTVQAVHLNIALAVHSCIDVHMLHQDTIWLFYRHRQQRHTKGRTAFSVQLYRQTTAGATAVHQRPSRAKRPA